jgi:asparagine synthase (glutamine-hydrolysing)
MCGIAGIYSFNGQTTSREEIGRMTDTLAHRGPDGHGTFVEDPVTLGHRRLSIIDLDSGEQPMTSLSGRCVIVFNGEIYNFRELRQRLAAKGHQFRTSSDTEIILALYEQYETNFLQHLAGMFAFALWDRQRQKLLLVRDRIGIKPLYTARHGGRLIFASEIKAIREVVPTLSELDAESVNAYFTRQYIGGTGTVFKGIEKISPGSYVEVSAQGVSRNIYWQPPATCPGEQSNGAAVARLDDLMRQSVREHLISDVPVGIFLSGGIDSGSILAYAAGISRNPLQTFSVGFGESSQLSETRYARLLAERYRTQHREIEVTYQEVLDCLPFIIRNLDQPLADYAILPTYIMSRFAAQHVKVVLSGEGADEVFGGYQRYHLFALLDKIGKTPLNPFLPRRHIPQPCLFRDAERRKLLNREFMPQSVLSAEARMRTDKAASLQAGQVNSMLLVDLRNWLVDDLLVKIDNMGMLASLEARVPFLDHRLVEYVLPLDGRLKVGLRAKKILLKRLVQAELPREIVARPKHGFTVPVHDWFRGPLKQHFQETVVDTLHVSDWLNHGFVHNLFQEHLAGKNHGLKLWSILVFNNWLSEHAV